MYKRTKEEWLKKIEEQLCFLEDFANEYDKGKIHYAIEMAIKLRILLYDNKSSNSLLTNFCSAYYVKTPYFLNNTYYPSNMEKETDSNFVRSNLCSFEFTLVPNSSQFMYPKPNMGKYGFMFKESFIPWWKKVTAISIGNNFHDILTRKSVVQLICNKEGGAHVDSHLPEKLTLLIRNEAKPLRLLVNDTIKYAKIDDLLYATIRQVTYETLFTLKPFIKNFM